MKLKHIDHINVVVKDLGTATEFFIKLGFRLEAERELEGKWIDNVVGLKNVKASFVSLKLPDGQTVLELLRYIQPKGHADPALGKANQIGYRHIAFQVDDIEEWRQKLERLGIECLSEVQTVPNYKEKKIFYFKGPEDILLELAEYPG